MKRNTIQIEKHTHEVIDAKLLFTDITGQCKFVIITFEELHKAFSEGIKVDGSDIIGLTGICENEFILWPISSSERLVHVNKNNVQFIYECKVTTVDGIDVKEIENELLQSVLNEAQILGLNTTNENQLLSILFPKTKTSIIHFAS
jgi:glutamine synthetase